MRAASGSRGPYPIPATERGPHEYARENHQYGQQADLSRRSFLVGTAATGVVLGYSTFQA